jgi:hypothetical protein
MDLSVRVAGSAIAGGAVELWGRMKELTKMCTGQFALDRLCSLPKSRATKGLASQAAKKLCFVSGHDLTCCKKTPASYNATTLQHAEKLKLCIRPTTLQVAKKLLLHITPRLWSMQETQALYQATTLHVAKKLLLHINATTLEHAGNSSFVYRPRLYRLQKNSCFI